MENRRYCCTVCGYLHLGDGPPDCCPVCGATPELFEASALPVDAPKSAPSRWRCINCDYLHDGDSPPECCPVCGVGSDRFEPVAQRRHGGASQALAGAIVIVGGGIAGLSAAEAAREAAPGSSVTLICQEDVPPYYRLNLTRYLAGEIAAADLPVHPKSWYAEKRITLLNSAEVTAIDRTAKTVAVKGHPALSYDRLVLATGAHPSVPPIDGSHRRNVVTLRTLRDAETILKLSPPGSKCVVVGGGVLGLEAAAALARREVQVALVEGFDWLLPRQLNRTAGDRLAREVRALGIRLVCGAAIKAIDGDDLARSVDLESGERLPADLVVVAAGVRSNSYLARLAQLEVNGGVLVDHFLRSSDRDVYAAGDLAEHQGVVYGTWAPAQYQGTIAGMNAAGALAHFAGIPRSNSLKVLGTDLFSIGLVHPEDASYRVFEESGRHFRQFVFRDARLVGAILVGDASLAPVLKKLIESGECCADLLAAASGPGDLAARLAARA